MRRILGSGLLLLALSLSTLPSTAVATAPGHHSSDRAAVAARQADRALARAQAALTGGGGDATMALVALRTSYSHLSATGKRQADALLARPTAGDADPYDDGYTVPAKVKCSTHFCIHWVTSTQDKAPSQAWVDTTLKTMGQVWSLEIGKLGYHQPITDGTRGGNSKFDVYLADVGSKGYYGYCAPEAYKPGSTHVAFGYCVLDNDFATAQFGAPPMLSLKVTAAHEFFHAIQFAYDVNEDHWIMEATATWMEERFADGANDNRQYLPYGQLANPEAPLDTFAFSSSAQYGNWIFFERLSDKFGIDVVRSIWHDLAAFTGAPDQFSVQAVSTVLANRGSSLASAYASFAGANTVPGKSYPEGAFYQPTPLVSTLELSEASPSTGTQNRVLQHLTSASYAVTPGAGLTDPGWQLSLSFDLPDTVTGSGVNVIVAHSDGTLGRTVVALDPTGAGTLVVPFSAASITGVTVSLANGSDRYNCWHKKEWACAGIPMDNNLTFSWSGMLVPPV